MTEYTAIAYQSNAKIISKKIAYYAYSLPDCSSGNASGERAFILGRRCGTGRFGMIFAGYSLMVNG
jgi:hypothetical protein